jgi:hypothetical protein
MIAFTGLIVSILAVVINNDQPEISCQLCDYCWKITNAHKLAQLFRRSIIRCTSADRTGFIPLGSCHRSGGLSINFFHFMKTADGQNIEFRLLHNLADFYAITMHFHRANPQARRQQRNDGSTRRLRWNYIVSSSFGRKTWIGHLDWHQSQTNVSKARYVRTLLELSLWQRFIQIWHNSEVAAEHLRASEFAASAAPCSCEISAWTCTGWTRTERSRRSRSMARTGRAGASKNTSGAVTRSGRGEQLNRRRRRW